MSKTNNLNDFLTDIADAIRSKKRTTGNINAQDFSNEIKSISSSSSSVSKVEDPTIYDYIVTVLDYDGTIIDKIPIMNGESLTIPTAPTHDNLTSVELIGRQGDINEDRTVGWLYKSSSGSTLLHHFKGTSATIKFVHKSNGVAQLGNDLTIDWGDGATENIPGSEATSDGVNKSYTHTYSDGLKHWIKISGNGWIGFDSQTAGSLENIDEVILGNNCLATHLYAFKNNEQIKNVTYAHFYTYLASEAFSNCKSLKHVSLVEKMTDIGAYAFSNCTSLETIVLPTKITSLGNSAFSGCTSLKTINTQHYVTKLENFCFKDCWSLKHINIENVTSISEHCFNNCYLLEDIIATSATSVLGSAFQNSGLITISLPAATAIGPQAFQNCNRLTSVYLLSDNLESISSYAFMGCSNLSKLVINATTPPTLLNSVFNSTDKLNIYVPDSSVETYKAATNWSQYQSIIKPLSECPE